MDIEFPRLPCSILSLDALDVTGEQHFGISHRIFKTRLGMYNFYSLFVVAGMI